MTGAHPGDIDVVDALWGVHSIIRPLELTSASLECTLQLVNNKPQSYPAAHCHQLLGHLRSNQPTGWGHIPAH